MKRLFKGEAYCLTGYGIIAASRNVLFGDGIYTEAVLKFKKLNTLAQQREALFKGEAYRLTGCGMLSIIPATVSQRNHCHQEGMSHVSSVP
ncbi:MAG: hypothetical protein LBK06_11265 [Planctomycetaceae bacterium]|nr:hypothetical protein [Planctomycetaceae bacterium]